MIFQVTGDRTEAQVNESLNRYCRRPIFAKEALYSLFTFTQQSPRYDREQLQVGAVGPPAKICELWNPLRPHLLISATAWIFHSSCLFFLFLEEGEGGFQCSVLIGWCCQERPSDEVFLSYVAFIFMHLLQQRAQLFDLFGNNLQDCASCFVVILILIEGLLALAAG